MRIKKGDNVIIQKGKDRGKSGKVIRVLNNEMKVIVEGLNLFKKHVRPKRQGEKGETVNVARPISVANVALECTHCKKGVRVGIRREKNIIMRVCKKCDQLFS